jgi:N-acetylmuramoyl-L-alanine amidase
MGLPLTIGARGEEVHDLQHRLAAAGFAVACRTPGVFDEATQAAVEEFQRVRGLDCTGLCDDATWQVLVEAGYRLGDRLLYLHAPMLRGDDVADLQLRLGSLGFDAGRVDGIFGPMTERALTEFQRNAGLTADGIAGTATISELCRLGAMSNASAPVSIVRERDRMRRAPHQLAGRHVVLGEMGGLGALVTATARHLRLAGGKVLTLHQPDGSAQASAANQFEAEVYVGLCLTSENRASLAYFATTGFESAGGRRLAEQCAPALLPLLQVPDVQVEGMRLPILRETRMPAMYARLGPSHLVVGRTAALAVALAGAIARWATTPLEP